MALNRIFKENERDNRARVVPEGTVSGDPLLIGTRPAVALTDRGDATKTVTQGDLSITLPSGGVGLAPTEASVAFNGTFQFEVTGATTATAQDAVVYITSAGALNLTASGNTRYGTVDYPVGYFKADGVLPVRVGG